MSEKKSTPNTKTTCTLCAEVVTDFLELEDLSDSGFILCASCEATSTTEDIYGADTLYDKYARSRKSIPNLSPYPRTTKIIKTIQTHLSPEEINAK